MIGILIKTRLTSSGLANKIVGIVNRTNPPVNLNPLTVMLFSDLSQSDKYRLVQLAARECNRYECNLSMRISKKINSSGFIVTTAEVIEQLKK